MNLEDLQKGPKPEAELSPSQKKRLPESPKSWKNMFASQEMDLQHHRPSEEESKDVSFEIMCP